MAARRKAKDSASGGEARPELLTDAELDALVTAGTAKNRRAHVRALRLSSAFRARLEAEYPALVPGFDKVMAAQDARLDTFVAGLEAIKEAGG